MSVEVKLELGHRACLRDKPTPEGFTHDWTVFVKGPGSGAEANSIQYFVDKVVFYLHESFPKPKRVIKEPPYQVSESGYASFIMPIEVFFRSKEEPKKVCFEYDLYLRIDGPPVSNIRYEKLTFQNPTEDFRRKLITAGGHLLGISGPANPPPMTEHHVEEHRLSSNLKTSGGGGEKKRHHSSTKEISKPPQPPLPAPIHAPSAPSQQPFNEIFGSPISKPKHSSGSASKTKEHGHLGQKSGKTVPAAASSTGKEAKLPTKETVTETRESKSAKPLKQEKESKPPVKRVSPVQAHCDSTPPEKKRRTSSSSHDDKSDGIVKQKIREVKDKEKHKTKSSSTTPLKKERDKTKNKSLTPPPKNKEPTKSPKPSAHSQRTDKYPSPLTECGSQEVCNSDTNSKSSKLDEPISPVPSTISENNKVSRPLSALYVEGDDSLLSPMSSDEENVPHPAKEKTEKKEDKEIGDSGNVQTVKTKPPTKSSSGSDKKAVKQKSSVKSTKEHSKPAHSENHSTKDSQHENQTSNTSEKETKQKKPVGSSNIKELIDLQQKIMALQDRNILQRIVDVIEKTGQYHMTNSSFDFDLCNLDDSTLRKLTYMFLK